ncbi:MAG: phage tail fiber protein, partial [Chloroflexota bacterium]
MPSLTDATANLMLEALDELATGGITHLGLHDDWPGTTGLNELAGGTPPYARQAATWGAAASRQKATSAGVTFDVPAGSTVRWVSLWTALTAGTFRGAVPAGGEARRPFVVPDVATLDT